MCLTRVKRPEYDPGEIVTAYKIVNVIPVFIGRKEDPVYTFEAWDLQYVSPYYNTKWVLNQSVESNRSSPVLTTEELARDIVDQGIHLWTCFNDALYDIHNYGPTAALLECTCRGGDVVACGEYADRASLVVNRCTPVKIRLFFIFTTFAKPQTCGFGFSEALVEGKYRDKVPIIVTSLWPSSLTNMKKLYAAVCRSPDLFLYHTIV